MRKGASTTARAIAAGCMLSVAALPGKAQVSPDSYSDLIARVMPSVVNISVEVPVASPRGGRTAPDQPRERVETMLGSGFIIDPSGYIVTNRHVVIGSYSIMVNMSDGTRLAAHVVGAPQG